MRVSDKLLVAAVACYSGAAVNVLLPLALDVGAVAVFNYLSAAFAVGAGTYALVTWRRVS